MGGFSVSRETTHTHTHTVVIWEAQTQLSPWLRSPGVIAFYSGDCPGWEHLTALPLSLVNLPAPQSRTNLSSLFHDGRVGSSVALVGADKATGAQETKAGGRDVPRGDLVLSWVPPTHAAAAHRAGCREGVGLPKATAGESKEKRSRGSGMPRLPVGPLWD